MLEVENNDNNESMKEEAKRLNLELKDSRIYRGDLSPTQKREFLKDLLHKYEIIINFIDDEEEVKKANFCKALATQELERVEKSIELNGLEKNEEQKDEEQKSKEDGEIDNI